jgi:hypothetical protein
MLIGCGMGVAVGIRVGVDVGDAGGKVEVIVGGRVKTTAGGRVGTGSGVAAWQAVNRRQKETTSKSVFLIFFPFRSMNDIL